MKETELEDVTVYINEGFYTEKELNSYLQIINDKREELEEKSPK